MTLKKVNIQPETAAYFLEVETALNLLIEKLRRISPVLHAECMQERHMQAVTSFNLNKRYSFRCDLHDNWDRSLRATKKWKTSNGVEE